MAVNKYGISMAARSVLLSFLLILLAIQRALHTISSVTALAPSSHVGPCGVSVALSDRAPKVTVAMSLLSTWRVSPSTATLRLGHCSSPATTSFCLLLLLLGGDVEANLGPAAVAHRTVPGRFKPLGETLVNSLSVLSLNARSLLPKRDELVALCLATSPDIVCITETWLSPDIADSEVSTPDYSLFRKDRNRRGGGVAMYVRQCLRAAVHPVLHSVPSAASLEILLLSIFSTKQRMNIGTFYRPPHTGSYYFASLHLLLEQLQPSDLENLCLCGDFNIDVNAVSCSTPLHKDLDLLCTQFLLSQVVSEPTHVTLNLASTIDLVLLSNLESLTNCSVSDPLANSLANSDHLSVVFTLSFAHRQPKNANRVRRVVWRYADADLGLASELFDSFDSQFAPSTEGVDDTWTTWKNEFWSIV